MIKKIRTILLWGFIFMCRIGFGQETPPCNQDVFTDSLLENLTGDWIATGSVGSEKVVYKFSIHWVLNHQFLEMFIEDTADKPEYSARVYIGYDCEKDNYVIHWIDNFGGAFSETLGYGKKKDQSIEMIFNYPSGVLNNTFTFDNKSKVWISHSTTKDENDQWTTFGNIILHRL